jgi:MarR family 2-MHQ and catechol resistance regulon transcriptional repressor
LAAKILKSTGNITHVINNLVKHKLVERRRDDDDRRYVTVHLTESGCRLIGQFFPQHVRRVVKMLDCLTVEEQNELARLCKKIGRKNSP